MKKIKILTFSILLIGSIFTVSDRLDASVARCYCLFGSPNDPSGRVTAAATCGEHSVNFTYNQELICEPMSGGPANHPGRATCVYSSWDPYFEQPYVEVHNSSPVVCRDANAQSIPCYADTSFNSKSKIHDGDEISDGCDLEIVY